MKRAIAAVAAVVVLTSGFTPVQDDVAQTDVPRWLCKMFVWLSCPS